MRFHQFDLNLLIYLDALLTERSVSRAAARVFITQSAMSEALSRMREYFSDELLVQVAGKRMVLTPLAESLISPVREILLRVQSVTTACTHFDPSKSNRKFSIMASDYVTDVLLTRLVHKLFHEAPGIRFEIRRLSPTSRDEIKRADLDLLIATAPVLSEDLPSERLWDDSITCIVWSQNRVFRDSPSLEQYLEMGHVCMMLDGHSLPDHDRWFLDHFGNTRKVEVVVPEFRMMCKMIEGTNRIASVFRRHAQIYAKQYSLRLVKPPVEFPTITEVMQWHHHQDRDPALVWLRNTIQSIANDSSSL